MLSQLLDQMDEYLSNKPFKRRWWSRSWKVHVTIQPPLSKDSPLWKRSKAELRLLRLFDLTPEELGQKIERYWKKPRWRRWFSSFGMNKKIDVWNYYQRCLAYQAVRPDTLEQESLIIASENRSLLNELGLVLHQCNVKFETHLEKRCHNPKWIEQHFLKEIKAYKQQLKKTFLIKLNKSLKQIKAQGDRFALKQQAEQEYQQVEALLLRYYRQRWNAFFSRPSQANLIPEIGTDVDQEGNMVNSERNLAVYNDSQTVSSSSQSILLIEDHQTEINSLHGTKEWIQTQRQRLNSLIEEGSLQKVEALLQTSLNEIKTIIELHLEYCEKVFSDIQGKHEAYEAFLKYLYNLQCRLKPLLQGGMLLFHPDHVMNLIPSQAMWKLISRYSQSYLEQSRCYLDRFKNYYLCIEEFYQLEKLVELVKDLEQSFQEFSNKLKESEAQRVRDKEELEAKLKESETQRAQDKEVMEAQRAQDKETMEAQRAQDKEAMEANLKELEAKFEAKLNKLFAHLTEQQPASTSSASNAQMQEKIKLNQNENPEHVNNQASITESMGKLINRPR